MKPESNQASGQGVEVDAGLAGLLAGMRKRASRGSPVPTLPEPRVAAVQVKASDDLVKCFTDAARLSGMSVYQTNTAAWVTCVRGLLRECGARKVFIGPRPNTVFSDEEAGELAAVLVQQGVQPHTTPDDETLFEVDASITGVDAAIAENGTIVCASAKDQARGASLIPPIHVAVLGTSQIVPDLCDYFDRLANMGAELPANVNLISGPSKTADIEGVLVTGVHGPGQVHIVLVQQ
ncbi:MAG: lactate utilization protein C [Planctomycetota bacterium]